VTHASLAASASKARPSRLRQFLRISESSIEAVGIGFLLPLIRIAAGDPVRVQLLELKHRLLLPLLGIIVFLATWASLAPMVTTSLGAIPGPVQVWQQAGNLVEDHQREAAKEEAFYQRLQARNEKLRAEGQADRIKQRAYTGKPTYLDQIGTSLTTVALGFLIATFIAIPLGIASGLSRSVNGALNPLVQLFKPVSPLAWLPIVTMVVSALYVDPSAWLPKSLVVSAVTVTLCSLWPTLIVLQLPTYQTILRVVLPSAMPLIFTGLRLSLGVGWMVLIAAEMLAQNPGLGKFVWDEFQNGSSDSLARIIVAVLTIGLIGFLLDRIMFALQQAFTFGESHR